ncbi:hypothetical protein L0F63_003435 [Massospora cicadina]|nr:hypothetical protein L0F63_003435 [Massospora cicadina]
MPTALPSAAQDGLRSPYNSTLKQEAQYLYTCPPPIEQRAGNAPLTNPAFLNSTTNPTAFQSMPAGSNSALLAYHGYFNQPSNPPSSQELASNARKMSADQGYNPTQLPNPRLDEPILKAFYTKPPNFGRPLPGPKKETLVFEGDIQEIPKNWSEEEKVNRRRLVQFWRRHDKDKILCSFNVVPPSSRPNNHAVSCIYWEERDQFFVTSVDCIHLLESLILINFTVEEKNRIRRNLEGFRPLTISKCKEDTAEFFKLIMAFPNPKPRNIEKDVKVFPWEVLQPAITKILNKYTPELASTPKYDALSYSTSSYNQVAGYQRRYSQPTSVQPYGQPYFAPQLSQMPVIPERNANDQFLRRHSMADPYSAQRVRTSAPSLPRVEENYAYCQPTGLGVGQGSWPLPNPHPPANPAPSHQPGRQNYQPSRQPEPSFFYSRCE